jgi:hypothetical protein
MQHAPQRDAGAFRGDCARPPAGRERVRRAAAMRASNGATAQG